MATSITSTSGAVKIKDLKLNDDLSSLTVDTIAEAPSDSKQYARKNASWEEVNSMRGVAVFVSATEPTDKEINDIWIQI